MYTGGESLCLAEVDGIGEVGVVVVTQIFEDWFCPPC